MKCAATTTNTTTTTTSTTTITNNNNNNRLMGAHRVGFHDVPPSVHIVDPVREEDRANYWLGKSDMALIQGDIKRTIRACNMAETYQIALDQDRFCVRGLEKHVDNRRFRDIRNNQLAVIRSVLEVQDNVRKMGNRIVVSNRHCTSSNNNNDDDDDVSINIICDEIGIRQAATALSKSATARAIEMGRLDAKAVAVANGYYAQDANETEDKRPRRHLFLSRKKSSSLSQRLESTRPLLQQSCQQNQTTAMSA